MLFVSRVWIQAGTGDWQNHGWLGGWQEAEVRHDCFQSRSLWATSLEIVSLKWLNHLWFYWTAFCRVCSHWASRDHTGLIFGKDSLDFLRSTQVMADALHDAPLLAASHAGDAKVPDAFVEAGLAHFVVGLEELSKSLLLVVRDDTGLCFRCSHTFKSTVQPFDGLDLIWIQKAKTNVL